MENVNAMIIVAGVGMIIMIIMFITWYNDSKKKKSNSAPTIDPVQEDVFKPIAEESPIPGVMPSTPGVVTEEVDDCCDDECACDEAEDAAPMMITINSTSRIKEKSRKYLMDSDANYTKKEADAILNNLSKAFTSVGLDLSKAPFEYTVK